MCRTFDPRLAAVLLIVSLPPLWGSVAETGVLQGQVKLVATGDPAHQINVLIVELGLTRKTDRDGRYRFEGLPVGEYTVVAFLAGLNSESELFTVSAETVSTVNLELELKAIKHEITVTSRGREETAFESVQSVISVDSFDLADKGSLTIGGALEGELGVAKRSFGPGSSRPIIRGFDSDRVLILEDGIRTGSLGSTSGDHGEPIAPTGLERLEVVKGPATLLYGSNAVGGVVNAISGHQNFAKQPGDGLRGHLTFTAGTANAQVGTLADAEYGIGNWLFWGGGGGQRSGNYDSADFEVPNSESRFSSINSGLGYFSDRAFASFAFAYDDKRYGIPFAEMFGGNGEGEGSGVEIDGIDVESNRSVYRFAGGLREFSSFVDEFLFTLNYSEWNQRELEVFVDGREEVGTDFDNNQFVYRGVFEQRPIGVLSGRFGFWGLSRDFDVAGAEALSPPIDQTNFALFTLQELRFERATVQFGGRFEHTRYDVQAPFSSGEGAEEEVVPLPDNEFNGASGGIGVRVNTWENGAFVANFVSSFRAPALEELYNNGPHIGTLSFETGDPNLERERIKSIDLGIRHLSGRLRAEANFFHYDINNLVFLNPTGEIEDGLPKAEYQQGDGRFAGGEAKLSVGLRDNLWFNFGFDVVDARLSQGDVALPRIPPVRARFGLDFRARGLTLSPEWVLSDKVDGGNLAPNETPTAGYGIFNLKASYTAPTGHFVHRFTVNAFNLNDRLYRNHTSFIKDFAPEIGRGVRFSYSVNFF